MKDDKWDALRIAEWFDSGYGGCESEAADELRRLHAEVEALKPDAARYRAIRKGLEIDPDNSGIVVSLIDDFGGETLRDEIADAAIDAAIAKATGETK